MPETAKPNLRGDLKDTLRRVDPDLHNPTYRVLITEEERALLIKLLEEPAPENDLEDVLDSYRLAGKLAGVQVFSVEHVVCWVGDIERAWQAHTFHIRTVAEPGPLFHQTYGAQALEDAAKWLRAQLDSQPFTFTHGRAVTEVSYEIIGSSGHRVSVSGDGPDIRESRE